MAGWNEQVIDEFRSNDGRTERWGDRLIVMHTTGAKSGELRLNPVMGMPNEGGWIVVASKGGAPEPPAWYLNLQAHPEVQVQVKGDRFTARARDATPEEKPEFWAIMTQQWPDYDEYQTKTDRPIPVVVLERR